VSDDHRARSEIDEGIPEGPVKPYVVSVITIAFPPRGYHLFCDTYAYAETVADEIFEQGFLRVTSDWSEDCDSWADRHSEWFRSIPLAQIRSVSVGRLGKL